MTKAEYVRLNLAEKQVGQENFLNAQLDLLNLIKSFHRFRVLRDEELVLKVTLKTYVEDVMKDVTRLERLLPKAHYQEEDVKKKDKAESKRRLSLDEEIAKIREKLGKLKEEII